MHRSGTACAGSQTVLSVVAVCCLRAHRDGLPTLPTALPGISPDKVLLWINVVTVSLGYKGLPSLSPTATPF